MNQRLDQSANDIGGKHCLQSPGSEGLAENETPELFPAVHERFSP
ncbi:hypothetical protein ABZ639_19575 [Saccharomonospora sp. NPDC006951]